jgi:hypothetical protein
MHCIGEPVTSVRESVASLEEAAKQLYLELVSYKHRNLKRAYWALRAMLASSRRARGRKAKPYSPGARKTDILIASYESCG